MGPKTRICVKTPDSLLLLGCYEARKEASHWTIYESGKRTRIETNHIFVQTYTVCSVRSLLEYKRDGQRGVLLLFLFYAHGLGWSSRDPRETAATQPSSWASPMRSPSGPRM